mgnify:CR=1 FL=1
MVLGRRDPGRHDVQQRAKLARDQPPERGPDRGFGRGQVVPDKLVPKLKRFWRFKKKRRESLNQDTPLSCAQSRRRLSKRRVQFAWRESKPNPP